MPDVAEMCKAGNKVPQAGGPVRRLFGRWWLRSMGWRLQGNFPNTNKLVLCVAPHTSNWDFFVGLAAVFALGLKLNFLAKDSLFKGPVGWGLRQLGGIAINRRQRHGVVAQLSQTLRQRPETLLCITPEGTRSPVTNWKTGFLQIAHQAQVPVLLVAFDYKKKQIVFGPVKQISENIEAEMAAVYEFYAKVPAKHPHNMAMPPAYFRGDKD